MPERVVWKYTLEAADRQEIEMPIGARILSVQLQGGLGPQMWALVDPSAERERRAFLLFGTGHTGVHGQYIGTFQWHNGVTVWHVFEDA
jgi:hypothetical protein